jgi:hypothetical protein
MATGRLGAFNITTTSDTTVYTVPSSTFSVVSVNVVNRNATTPVNIRIAVSALATPTVAEYIEYDSSLVANGVLERTGIVMKVGDLLVVSTPTATPTLSVVVYGIETSTA